MVRGELSPSECACYAAARLAAGALGGLLARAVVGTTLESKTTSWKVFVTLTGCTSSRTPRPTLTSSATGSRSVPPWSSPPLSAPPMPTGITGFLRTVGGPPPGTERGVPGQVVLTAQATRGFVPLVAVARADGRYTASVKPGTYLVQGRTGTSGPYCGQTTVTVAANQTIRADVTCAIP